tara:strand:- start:87 stop:785 length:699 start_codon:yes stop_codon:yes gene_type:complete
MLNQICAPALLYIAFSVTQIIIDIFKGMTNTAFFKFIVMIVFSIILNVLCSRGLGVISWFIVFVPFIMMTIITTMLLFVFGLSPTSGNLNYSVDYPGKTDTVVVTNTGVNQPYQDGEELMPGSYSQIPTADQVNNYDGSGGDGSSSTQQHHHHKHHHKHYPKHPKNYGDCIKGPNDKACLNGGSAVGKKPDCKCDCPEGWSGDYCEQQLLGPGGTQQLLGPGAETPSWLPQN